VPESRVYQFAFVVFGIIAAQGFAVMLGQPMLLGFVMLVIGVAGMWLSLKYEPREALRTTGNTSVISREYVFKLYSAICNLADDLSVKLDDETLKRRKTYLMSLARKSRDADVVRRARLAIRLFDEGQRHYFRQVNRGVVGEFMAKAELARYTQAMAKVSDIILEVTKRNE
jgi:hypothetical protein